MELTIAGVIKESIVDGPGIRYTVFTQGCPHHCPGCHNPQTHDFSGGKEVPLEKILSEIRKNPLLQGVTFSGGEPFCQAAAFAELGRRIKALPCQLDLTVYSGFTFEKLMQMAQTDSDARSLLSICDILVDGPYLQEERDLSLHFRGSRNQRYLDLRRSIREGAAVSAPEKPIPARLRYAGHSA